MNETIPNYNNNKYDPELYFKLREQVNDELSNAPTVRGVPFGGKGRGFRSPSFSSSLINQSQQERITSQNLTLLRIFEDEGVDLV